MYGIYDGNYVVPGAAGTISASSFAIIFDVSVELDQYEPGFCEWALEDQNGG